MGRCLNCHSTYDGDERFCPVDGGAVVDGDPDDPLIGQTIDNRYLIRSQLGKGGMGAVYRADHINIDKSFAIKFILDKYTEEMEVVSRFHREARTAASVGHPSIVNVIDFGSTDSGRHFIVMEMLEGVDLGKEIRDNGRLRPARAILIARQLLSGLAAAHGKGVVHRDLKPENVLLVNGPGGEQAKLMDFGISKIMTAHDSQVRLTGTGTVVGTPTYIAPEQATADENADHRVDLYSLGVMLYEMLTGKPPFTAPNYLSLVTKHLQEKHQPLGLYVEGLPVQLTDAVDRALEKDPNDRFDSAAEFEAALLIASQALGDRATGPTSIPGVGTDRFAPTSIRGRATTPVAARADTVSVPQPRRAGMWIAAAAVVAIGGAGIALYASGADETEPATRSAEAPADQDSPAGPSVKPLAPATLLVESTPAGAAVFIDGERRGDTPLELARIEGSSVQVRLELGGYHPVTVDKALGAGQRETLFVPLSLLSVPAETAAKTAAKSARRSRPSSRRTKPATADTPATASHLDKPATDPKRSDSEAATAVSPAPKPKPKPNKPPSQPKDDKKPNPYL